MTESVDRERFESAVKIITGLPKDGKKLKFHYTSAYVTVNAEGSFQPSNDLKLKFYGYYKQATIGPCLESKPGFWDVVRRAKWEAWKCLGDMSKEDAMKGYVETLKQVVETMTLSADVQDFLSQLGPVYEMVTPEGNTVTTHEQLPSDTEYEVLSPVNGKVTFANGGVKMNGYQNDEAKLNPIESKVYVKGSSSLSLSDSPSDDEAFTDAPDAQTGSNYILPKNFVTAEVSNNPPGALEQSIHSPVSVSESKGVQSDEDRAVDKLPKDRRRAAYALGRALRNVPDLKPNTEWGNSLRGRTPEECNDALVRAWEAVSQMRVQNLSWTDENDDKLFRRLMRPKASTRKHRGRGSGGSASDREKSRQQPDSDGHSSASEPSGFNDRPPHDEPGHSRDGRHSSGTSSESSKDSAGFDWDPHVGAVLLRMHRELQHISRQLELMEGILITQQQMIRNALVQSDQTSKGLFFSLPWRTILFIMIWPIVVNFAVRFGWFRILKRRRL